MIESDEALTFRAMMRQSRETIVAADSSKIGIVTSALIGPISEVHILITDARAIDKAIAPFLK